MFAPKPEHFAKTPRYAALARLQSYVDGTQYDGRPDFFTGDCPVRERKPCVIYPLPESAIDEATRFTFGEGRFPALCVRPVEANAAIAGLALAKDAAELLESAIAEIAAQSNLRSVMRALLRCGLGTKSAPTIVCLRDGKFAVDMPRPQDCWPTYRREGDPKSDVVAMTWCYQFSRLVADRNGEPTTAPHFWRRDVTALEFIDYEPALIETNKPIEWVEKGRTKHGFTRCPVIWMRNLPDQHCGDMDGTSLLDGQLDEFDALNFTLSQRHRGIDALGTPQPYETGVAENDGPAQDGRTAVEPTGPKGFSRGSAGPAPHTIATRSKAARVRAPNVIWRYEGVDVTVGLIETTGKAFEVASAHVDDISARCKQAMGVVLANAADTLGKGDMSAKFLALVYAPLLALVDELRECWGDHLVALLELMLRGVMDCGGAGLLIPQAAQVASLLKGRVVVTTDGPIWVAPRIDLNWGAYFSPSNDDVKTDVEAAAKAVESKLVPPREATTYVAPNFGLRDIDEALERMGHIEAKPGVAPTVDGESEGGADPNAAASAMTLTPSDMGAIVRVDEARAKIGLGPYGGPDGALTIAAFKAKHAEVVASSAAAEAGKTQPVDPAEEAKTKADAMAKRPIGAPFGQPTAPIDSKVVAANKTEQV